MRERAMRGGVIHKTCTRGFAVTATRQGPVHTLAQHIGRRALPGVGKFPRAMGKSPSERRGPTVSIIDLTVGAILDKVFPAVSTIVVALILSNSS